MYCGKTTSTVQIPDCSTFKVIKAKSPTWYSLLIQPYKEFILLFNIVLRQQEWLVQLGPFSSVFNLKTLVLRCADVCIEALTLKHQHRTPEWMQRRKAGVSGHAASLCAFSSFLCCTLFCVWTPSNFGFDLEHLDLPMAAEVHRFGFGCLGGLCWLWGDSRGRGKTLSTRTGFEPVDILDPPTPQFRWIGTGGSHLQVNFLNPPR